MNGILFVCLLGGVSVALAGTEPHYRGCIYILGNCVSECEEGTHAYALGCGRVTPEATCGEPHPVVAAHIICDYSECYCDPPTVRDTVSDKCVLLEDCPKNVTVT